MDALANVEKLISNTVDEYGYISNERICEICIQEGLDIVDVDRVFDRIFMKDTVVVDAPEMINTQYLKKYLRGLTRVDSNKKTALIKREKKTIIPQIEEILLFLHSLEGDFEAYIKEGKTKKLETLLIAYKDFKYDKKYVFDFLKYCELLEAKNQRKNIALSDETLVFNFLSERAGQLYRPEVISKTLGIPYDVVVNILQNSSWVEYKWSSYFVPKNNNAIFNTNNKLQNSRKSNFDYVKSLNEDELANFLAVVAKDGEKFFDSSLICNFEIESRKASEWLKLDYIQPEKDSNIYSDAKDLLKRENMERSFVKEDYINYLRAEKFVERVIKSYIEELDSFIISSDTGARVYDCKSIKEIDSCIELAKGSTATVRTALKYFKLFFKARNYET